LLSHQWLQTSAYTASNLFRINTPVVTLSAGVRSEDTLLQQFIALGARSLTANAATNDPSLTEAIYEAVDQQLTASGQAQTISKAMVSSVDNASIEFTSPISQFSGYFSRRSSESEILGARALSPSGLEENAGARYTTTAYSRIDNVSPSPTPTNPVSNLPALPGVIGSEVSIIADASMAIQNLNYASVEQLRGFQTFFGFNRTDIEEAFSNPKLQ
jgi:hypothetical protein